MPLTTAGRDELANLIVGAGTPFNAANAHLGVGDSSTAFNASQTDLVAATNKFREIVNGAPGVATNVITFVATFETSLSEPAELTATTPTYHVPCDRFSTV